jgi:hypothetical protein
MASIPGILLMMPWQPARAWSASALVVLDAAGHDRGDPGMAEALVRAMRRFQR